MALIRAMNAAISGLLAQQTKIDVIGDNLANVTTTGFKATRVQFENLLSQQLTSGVAPQGNLGGVNPMQIGLGVRVAETTKDFRSGSLDATGLNTDMALEGDGFFILRDETGAFVYSRDGSFTLNPSNMLHNPSNGYIVQGIVADDDGVLPVGQGTLTNIEIRMGEQTIAKETSDVVLNGNLNSGGPIARNGAVVNSEIMFVKDSAGSGTAFDGNPNAYRVATFDTLLTNIVTLDGNGNMDQLTLQDGDELDLSFRKGGEVINNTFTIGEEPPAGGTTLGDLMNFLQLAMGIDNLSNPTQGLKYGALRAGASGTVNNTASGDVATANMLIEMAPTTNFAASGVKSGDVLRFTAGQAAGQLVQVAQVMYNPISGRNSALYDPTTQITSGGPAVGDQYVIHRAAGTQLNFPIDTSAQTVFSGALTGAIAENLTVTDDGMGNYTLSFFKQDENNNNLDLAQDLGMSDGDWVRFTKGFLAGREYQIELSPGDTENIQFTIGSAELLELGINTTADMEEAMSAQPDDPTIRGASPEFTLFTNHQISGNVAQNDGNLDGSAAQMLNVTQDGITFDYTVTFRQQNQAGADIDFIDDLELATDDVIRFTNGPLAGREFAITLSGAAPNDLTFTITNAEAIELGLVDAPTLQADLSAGTDFFSARDVGMAHSRVDGLGVLNLEGNIGAANDITEFELKSGVNDLAQFAKTISADGESVRTNFTVFDSLGTPRQVEVTFVYERSTDEGNIFRWFAESPANSGPERIVGSGTVQFSTNGQYLVDSPGLNHITIDLANSTDDTSPNNVAPSGAVDPLTFNLDMKALTGFAADTDARGNPLNGSNVFVLTQDGFEKGTLIDFGIGTNGLITGIFDNGLTQDLGQIKVARFANNNGLIVDGANNFRVGVNSGIPQIGDPGTGGRGLVRSGFLEESNVELSRQFTDLIVSQRAFQANARTITVSDGLLQELVNLI